MQIVKSPEKLYSLLEKKRRQGKKIGFVPTMGALHEGHLSLIRTARREADIVVVSIFVNPTQFGPKEDLGKYPRPVAADRKKLRTNKVDFLFAPDVKAMYPSGFATEVHVGEIGKAAKLATVLCGKFRPGHFTGVATIVAKLFHIVNPHLAYFGAKDFQQSVIVGRLIRDLNMAVRLRVLPTVREEDGLAVSSRNRYLSASERKRALSLSSTLSWIRDEVRSGRKDLVGLKGQALRRLRLSVDHIDYLEIVDPQTLEPLRRSRPEMVALAACFVGKTRLIDNVIIKI